MTEETKKAIDMEEENGKFVQKQSAFAEDGVTIDAQKMIIDPEKYRWKAFLAGPSGSGKTVAIATLPGKKLLVDFDNRAEAVAGIPDIKIYPIHEVDPKSPKAWQKALRLKDVIISEIRQGIFPFNAVCFDGLTMMGRISMNWALLLDNKRGLGGSPARQHYGPQMDNLAKYVLSTLALPIHIIYTGHIELFQDEATGAQKFYPKITGKLRTEVANWFNETYYCYRTHNDDGKLCYYWQTGGSGRQEFFKSSLNALGRYWEDPIQIDFEAEAPQGFKGLMEKRFNPTSKEVEKEKS
ncbi:AAA family ATPase [bacterium]|nr:AAA family ATPase [bacterium]